MVENKVKRWRKSYKRSLAKFLGASVGASMTRGIYALRMDSQATSATVHPYQTKVWHYRLLIADIRYIRAEWANKQKREREDLSLVSGHCIVFHEQ